VADWLPEGWSLPQLLLVALALTVVLTGVVAAGTSQTAFSTYNAAWDGASELRDVATEQGADPVVALNTSQYAATDPNETIAVVLSPDEAYSPQDRQRLAAFVQQGGTVVIAEDFGATTTPLLTAVSADTRFDGAPLRDEQEYYRSPALPVATNVSDQPETRNVDQLTLNYATSLDVDATANDTTVLVRSSEFAYLDTDRDGELDDNETLASRPVVVRERAANGTVYVVSDPSVFINAMLERPGNAQFARNLFADRETVLLDYSHVTGQPPLAVALLTLQESPFWQVLVGSAGIGAIVWGRRLRDVAGGLAERLRRDRPADRITLSDADPEEIVAHLQRRHPDWDERRLRRVMRGVIRSDEATQDDD
jgi:hypothetical protein